MLPAVHRLRRREDFAVAFRAGRRAGRPSLVVHLAEPQRDSPSADDATSVEDPKAVGAGVGEQPSPPPVLVGFVVSKAVGPAVTRNLVKRRLRHLMAERIDELTPGGVVVVRALPASAAVSYGRLGEDLDAALRKLRSGRRTGRVGRSA